MRITDKTSPWCGSDGELVELYLRWNRTYFDGKLPKKNVSLRFVRLIGSDGARMLGHFRGEPIHCGGRRVGRSWTIHIDTRFRDWRAIWAMTLLHEMAHLFVDRWRQVGVRERGEHPKRWKMLMRELAAKGAFDGLW